MIEVTYYAYYAQSGNAFLPLLVHKSATYLIHGDMPFLFCREAIYKTSSLN